MYFYCTTACAGFFFFFIITQMFRWPCLEMEHTFVKRCYSERMSRII